MDTDKTTIRASLDSFTVYVVQHRDSTAAAMYAENATFMPPNQSMVQGRANIRTWMKSVPPMSHFTASPIEINGRGDLAYVRGTYQVSWAAGGTERGKFLEIRRREPDGRWLIAVDIFNTDTLPPAPPAAPARR
jgi:ketosteroid isomerase-like protein